MAHIGNAPFGKTVRTVTTETLTSVKTAFYPTGGYIVGYVDVYVNGVRLTEAADFVATDGTTVTLQYNPSIGDTVDVVTYGSIEMANAVRRDGDTLVGTLFTRALIPTANITYDIGTDTMRYKDIYLSGNTINLGDIKLSTNGTAFSVANTTGGAFPSALANTTITGTLTQTSNAGLVASFDSTHTSGGYLTWRTGNTIIADLGTTEQCFGDSSGANNFAINARGLRYLAFGTNNTVRTTIVANGHVGIGNTTPASKLHVAGSIGIDTDNALRTGPSGVWLIGSSNTEITIGSQSTGAGRKIGLYSNASSTAAISCGNLGKVGINGVNPDNIRMPNNFSNAYAGYIPSLYVNGPGTFSDQGSGSSYPDMQSAALILGPKTQRSVGTGLFHGGIAFDHLLNYTQTGDTLYGASPHVWIGLKQYDTPGYERSSFVIATRQTVDGTGRTLERFNVDPFGRVTMPYQPSFSMYCNVNVNGEQIVPFNGTKFNNGGHYDTATYKFTAPVAGRYFFSVYDNMQANSGAGCYFRFLVNGAQRGSFIYASAPSAGWFLLSGSEILDLAVNDYVQVGMVGAGIHPDYGNNWGSFSGFLIG